MKTFSRIALVSVALVGASTANASERVRAAQEMLKALGYSTSVDGDFGEGTQSATRRFQRANGLRVSGALDSSTISKLREMSGIEGGSVTTSTTVTTSSTSTNSASTRQLQRQLALLGYYNGPVDGQRGTATTTAIKEFQGDYGYQITGELDAQGRALVASEYAKMTDASSVPTEVLTSDVADVVETETIAAVPAARPSAFLQKSQRQLTELGFNTGGADGLDGPRTRSAIKAYQRSLGLEQVGRLGPKTRAALKRDYAEYQATGKRPNRGNGDAFEPEETNTAEPAGPRVPFWKRFNGTSSVEVTTGLGFGGDELRFDIDGNTGSYATVGWQYIGKKNHGIKLSLGYAEDNESGNDRSAVFKRMPLDIMYVRKWQRYHFNAGVTTHLRTRYRENVNGARLRSSAGTSLGLAVEADYDLKFENLAVGVRGQIIEYDFDGISDDISGSGASIFLRGRWK